LSETISLFLWKRFSQFVREGAGVCMHAP